MLRAHWKKPQPNTNNKAVRPELENQTGSQRGNKMSLNTDKAKDYIEGSGVRCPFCKSDDIEAGPFDGETSSCPVTCNRCGKEWDDCYTLTGIQVDDHVIEAKSQDDDPIIYSIRRSDIAGVVEDDPDYEGKMTPAVIAEVERQLFKMDFSDMADTIRIMIDDAISAGL